MDVQLDLESLILKNTGNIFDFDRLPPENAEKV